LFYEEDLQESLWREKVLRARAMKPEERWAEVFDLTNRQFSLMLAGAMHRLQTTDKEKGWAEVKKQVDRLHMRKRHELYQQDQMVQV
jgi:hypothetical protein